MRRRRCRPQLVIPDLTSEARMSVSITPTMRGGKSFQIALGGMKAMATAIRRHKQQVPMKTPTASGYASFTPLA